MLSCQFCFVNIKNVRVNVNVVKVSNCQWKQYVRSNDLCAHQHSMFHFISIPVLSRDVALLSTPSISCTELCPTFVYKHHLAKQCHGCQNYFISQYYGYLSKLDYCKFIQLYSNVSYCRTKLLKCQFNRYSRRHLSMFTRVYYVNGALYMI